MGRIDLLDSILFDLYCDAFNDDGEMDYDVVRDYCRRYPEFSIQIVERAATIFADMQVDQREEHDEEDWKDAEDLKRYALQRLNRQLAPIN